MGTTNPTVKLDVFGDTLVTGIATISGKSRVKGGDLFVQDNLTGVQQISHRAFYNNSYYANDVAKFVQAGGHPQVAVFGNYFNNSSMGAELSIVRSHSGFTGIDGAVSTAGAPVGGIKFGASISNQMVQAGFFGAFLSESGTFNDTSKPTDFRFYTNPNGAIVPTEKVRITSEGNVGIGSTLPTSKLDVVGDVSATNFNSASDAALKTNVQVIDNPLEKVLQINGVSFNWIENNKPSMGVIAQELEGVIPELVKGDDTTTRSVNYNGLIGLLIEVVKEQQTQIDSLNDRLSRLE